MFGATRKARIACTSSDMRDSTGWKSVPNQSLFMRRVPAPRPRNTRPGAASWICRIEAAWAQGLRVNA